MFFAYNLILIFTKVIYVRISCSPQRISIIIVELFAVHDVKGHLLLRRCAATATAIMKRSVFFLSFTTVAVKCQSRHVHNVYKVLDWKIDLFLT